MSDHGREHEDWLARVLAGEVDPGSPAAGERLAACPDCRRELARLGPLAADLRELSGRERTDLARAREQTDGADEDLVRGSLERALAAERRRRRRPFVVALAAAVVLVVLGLAIRNVLSTQREPEILLGGDEITELSPRGEQRLGAEAYPEFRWSYDLPPGGYFVLRIRPIVDGVAGEPVELEMDEPKWIPTPEERAALADRIRWEVEAYDAFDERVARGSQEAWRP